MSVEPDVVDLFGGPGGWAWALTELGMTEVGVEVDAVAVATRDAAGFRTVHADVVCLDPRDFGSPAGLIASPPCPPFSSAGTKDGFDDPRAPLVWEPLRWIAHLRPEWVALEQVKGAEIVWRCYEQPLRLMGYDVLVRVLDAADYGVPQNRERAILVASTDRARLPEPTHAAVPGMLGELPHVTMANALGLEPGWEYDSGQNSTLGGGIKGRYVRSCDRPAGTVTGQTTSQWVLRRGHERRKLTLADSARLQTFPVDYPFVGTTAEKSQQIGNAVPPLLARRIVAALCDIQAESVAA